MEQSGMNAEERYEAARQAARDCLTIRGRIATRYAAIMAEHGVAMTEGNPEKARGAFIFSVGLWPGTNGKVAITRSPHASEGTGVKVVTVMKGLTEGDEMTPNLVDSITRGAKELGRLLRRDAAIRRHAHILQPPGWAYTMHEVALSMLRSTGQDPCAILLPYEGMARFCPTPSQSGITISIGHRPEYTDSFIEARRERMACAPLRMRLGDQIVRYNDGPRPNLQIERLRFPDTLVSAIAGQRLRDVIAHPTFDGLGTVIKSAGMTGTDAAERLTFFFADRQERLAPLPPGETPDWRTPT